MVRRSIFSLLLLFLALPVMAAMGLEILTLKHRGADEVLPLVRPFLAPGATATGMNDKLFLRTTPENAAEIRRMLATIDREARRLLVRVSQDREATTTRRGAEISGDVALGDHARVVRPPAPSGGSSVEIRRGDSAVRADVVDTRSLRSGSGSQSIQVIEGGRGYINVGVSVAVPLRRVFVGPQGTVFTETVEIHDIGSGFTVEPRLNGDRVTLEISLGHDAPAAGGPGAVSRQRLATTVSGRLGEWIALGGAAQQGRSERGTTLGGSTRELRESRGLWLLVEELP